MGTCDCLFELISLLCSICLTAESFSCHFWLWIATSCYVAMHTILSIYKIELCLRPDWFSFITCIIPNRSTYLCVPHQSIQSIWLILSALWKSIILPNELYSDQMVNLYCAFCVVYIYYCHTHLTFLFVSNSTTANVADSVPPRRKHGIFY